MPGEGKKEVTYRCYSDDDDCYGHHTIIIEASSYVGNCPFCGCGDVVTISENPIRNAHREI